MLTFGAESKEFSWGSSNVQTTVVGFGHGTEKTNTTSMAKLMCFRGHPDREEQFGLVKPLIAEIGMVSVFITSLPVASFPSHIFSMVRSIIYECICKRNRLIEHHAAFCS